MTVNLAVVGLGAFGQKHLDALAQIDDATIHSVAHSKLDVATEVAAKFGARAAFTDYAELLAQPDLDGVILATPTPDAPRSDDPGASRGQARHGRNPHG